MTQRSLFTFILAGALCALGAELLQASCGDWLVHPDPAAVSGQPSAELPQPLRPSPCQGPHCGESPSAPLLPPLPVVERHHDAVAYLDRPSPSSQAAGRFLTPELTFYLPLGSRQRIDRPPIYGCCAVV